MASTSRPASPRRAGLLGTQVALAALLWWSPAWPATTAEPGGPAAGSLGAIAGRVTDDATGDPLPNVFVVIHDQSGVVTSELTDADGNYVASGLPTGTYRARTSSSTHLDELYDDIACPSFCNLLTGTPIPVTGGSTTSGIDFALPEGGVLTGTVTDADGTPIPGVRVHLSGVDFNDRSRATDGDGVYSFPDLETGTYFVRTTFAGFHVNELYDDLPCPFFFLCDPTDGTPIAVTQGTTTAGIDLALDRGGAIAGKVAAEETGLPILGVNVAIYDENGRRVGGGFTFADGFYSSVGLPAGTYYARTVKQSLYANERFDELPCLFTCPLLESTPITVVLGATTGGVDFTLARRPIFWDGLESGGLGFWSDAAGGLACFHPMCFIGGWLAESCDPCVDRICGRDPFCCTSFWDPLCVLAVESVCSLECPGGPVIPDGDTEAPTPRPGGAEKR